ncbi:hypothetical protein MYX84_12005 [Acidobacteria bacterium AH-259-O06]|nr:hypothetical protein [Acidobacteria bacterium AH-259-O06]
MDKKSLGQIGLVFLIALLSIYLSAAAELQLFLDLSEATRHPLTTAQGNSYSPLSFTDLTHDCHSCLASHPNISVSPALHDFLQLDLEKNRRCEIPTFSFTLSEHLRGINNRSPPA